MFELTSQITMPRVDEFLEQKFKPLTLEDLRERYSQW
jgi:hypothetical protein